MKINEFAKKTGISASTLRYYEQKGFLKVKRINGIRDFEEKDLEYAAFIKRLKDMGMPLAQIKEYADLRYQGEKTTPERLKILEGHRLFLQKQLSQYQTYIEKLNEKTALYRSHITSSQQDNEFL
ncbi:MerR family transcriptional regulator [Streptococcus ratti]|uniref:MerR family transcriptional regulator n=1 Tax=Streptococcus ratti TaxID=1341 RepID=A0A7X9LDC0_STRRT|nr:MerR family transcriptional regulator [Streptococcus ratti]NMD48682.1 MerR family transcriptional regulator [Streptococcus ratti]